MSEEIVSQEEQEVKQCDVEGCDEPVFREELCWEHFLQGVVGGWDAEEPEEVDFIFGDPVDGAWFGYKPEEVLA
jgi:hypothetical protein